jgi:hypothetical protein
MESHGGMLLMEKLLIHPPELSGNSTSSHLVAKWQEHGEGNAEFCLQSISSIRGFIIMP